MPQRLTHLAAPCVLSLLLGPWGSTVAADDPASPASTPVFLESSGSTIQAHLYQGEGGGRRPTVLLLP